MLAARGFRQSNWATGPYCATREGVGEYVEGTEYSADVGHETGRGEDAGLSDMLAKRREK